MILHPLSPSAPQGNDGKANQALILKELENLTAFASQLFLEIETRFDTSTQRLLEINQRTEALRNGKCKRSLDLFSSAADEASSHRSEKRFAFTKQSSAIAELFHSSQPNPLTVLKAECDPGPDFSSFSDEVFKNFSNPQFFLQEWVRTEEAVMDAEERKQRQERELRKQQKKKKTPPPPPPSSSSTTSTAFVPVTTAAASLPPTRPQRRPRTVALPSEAVVTTTIPPPPLKVSPPPPLPIATTTALLSPPPPPVLPTAPKPPMRSKSERQRPPPPPPLVVVNAAVQQVRPPPPPPICTPVVPSLPAAPVVVVEEPSFKRKPAPPPPPPSPLPFSSAPSVPVVVVAPSPPPPPLPISSLVEEALPPSENNDNDSLNKYRKMLKMNLPRGAVEQKMKQDGIHPGLLFPDFKDTTSTPITISVTKKTQLPPSSNSNNSSNNMMSEILTRGSSGLRKMEPREVEVKSIVSPVNDLMQGILQGAGRLRKVEVPSVDTKKKNTVAEGSDVANVLARRMAIMGEQGSDTDSDAGSGWGDSDDE